MIEVPIPETLIQITWFLIGLLFARSFGKKLDNEIKKTEWYKGQATLPKWLIAHTLDFLHHFWMGLLLMVYFSEYPEIFWFGAGLLVDDIPDIPARYQNLFKSLKA